MCPYRQKGAGSIKFEPESKEEENSAYVHKRSREKNKSGKSADVATTATHSRGD